jgi:hypothetical protein
MFSINTKLQEPIGSDDTFDPDFYQKLARQLLSLTQARGRVMEK